MSILNQFLYLVLYSSRLSQDDLVKASNGDQVVAQDWVSVAGRLPTRPVQAGRQAGRGEGGRSKGGPEGGAEGGPGGQEECRGDRRCGEEGETAEQNCGELD